MRRICSFCPFHCIDFFGVMMMKDGVRMDALAARVTALPQESFGFAPKITISGKVHVLVEGIRALEEYTPELIAASVGGGMVLIRGTELELVAMSRSELAVSGHIQGVSLE